MAETEFIVEPGTQYIVISREFDAPPEVVFRACTDPDLIPKWWGPRSTTTVVDRMDVRTGGQWRFVHRDPDGTEYGFRGVYHDVVPNQRVVQTFEFELVPGHVALESMTLEDLGGKTRMVGRSVYGSVEDRDAAVRSGMEAGARETYERLAELVERP